MKDISKKIILDELIEDAHHEKVEDVIFWALEAYSKNRDTSGSIIAYSIVERIKDAEKLGSETYMNHEKIQLMIAKKNNNHNEGTFKNLTQDDLPPNVRLNRDKK